MYETAKAARAALKSKARRLTEESNAKPDSSDFSPAEPLNADAKTGARPVSRRAYKSGGKVMGACAPCRADRKPRKSGGRALTADSLMNRNEKDANEEREGVKHVGGYKKGGRAKKAEGGVPLPPRRPASLSRDVQPSDLYTPDQVKKLEQGPRAPEASDLYTREQMKRLEQGRKAGGRAKKNIGGALAMLSPAAALYEATKGDKDDKGMKRGGRAKKEEGGEVVQAKPQQMYRAPRDFSEADRAMAQKRLGLSDKDANWSGGQRMIDDEASRRANVNREQGVTELKKGGRAKKMLGGPMMDPRMGIVKPTTLENGTAVVPGVSAMKKGGRAKWEGSAKDQAQDKKLAKKHGMSMKAWESSKLDDKHDKQQSTKGLKDGGRMCRASGGRAKGKTNINIVIATGGKPQDQGMPAMPPGGPGGLPPMPPMGKPPVGGPPMPPPGALPPMAGAGGPPPMPPGGMPPMARKAGGRVYRSYKDMDAGAASGLGRVEKSEIAARQPKPGLKRGEIVSDNKGYPNKVNGATGGRTARMAGGKVYRTAKDMDAGSGSGLGRMEKSEIQKRAGGR